MLFFICMYIVFPIGLGLWAMDSYIQCRKYSKIMQKYNTSVDEMLELSERQLKLSVALIENNKKHQF